MISNHDKFSTAPQVLSQVRASGLFSDRGLQSQSLSCNPKIGGGHMPCKEVVESQVAQWAIVARPHALRLLLTYRIDCIQITGVLMVFHRTLPPTLPDSSPTQSSKFRLRRAKPFAHEIGHLTPGHGKE